ncbi:MAG TPA: Ig-like domain-containing protein, partial [Pirellulales bacterium]|nr:Ig-like domain-containing protein [Pirellulales bacterium]
PSDPSVFATPPTIDPATGDLKFRFIPNFNGFSNVTVKLHDNGGTANGGVDTSAIQTFRLTSNFVNDAPIFVAGPDQTVNENAPAQTVTNWATSISPGPGSNEAGQTLGFTATNTNPSLFAAAPSVNPATGALTYTPALNAFGSASVTVTLHDNGGTANGGVDSFSQTFTITVNFVNHAPTFVGGGDQVVNENAPLQTPAWATQISAGPSNESGEALNFIVTTDNNTLFLTPPTIDPTTGVLTYQPAAYASGVANVSVALHDDAGTANGGADTSAVQTFKITVNFVNQPPSFTLGPNQVVNEDAPPQVVTNFAKNISPGPGSNEAGEALDFIISTDNAALFSAPPTIDGATGTLRYTLAPHASGQANVTVQLHDNGGTANNGINISPPQAFTITANFVNHAPTFVLQSGDRVVNENAGPQSIPGIASQPSPGPGGAETGQALNYITTNDNNALFAVQPSIDLTGRLTFTPAPQMFGVATVSVALHDNGGTANGGSDTSAMQTFRIILNAPPTANADLYDISFASTSSSTVATGVLSNDVDPNGDPLSAILVSGTTHGTLTLRADGSFSYSPNPDFQGVDQFTYKASDGRSESGVVTVGILGHDDGSNIRKLYEQVLHRDPDAAGLAYWTNQIHHGATLADVGASIFESNERLDPILTSYYEQFLLRAPDPQGLAYWRDQVWKVVGGPEPVIAGMISSPEFFQSAGGTDAAWVAALYQRLLNRTADPAGLQYWDNLLETHSMTEFQVVEGFLSSDEYFTNLIDGFFETYLDRMPTASELANDLAQMHGGASQRDIQFEIVDTDEYRNTPPPPALGTVKRLA